MTTGAGDGRDNAVDVLIDASLRRRFEPPAGAGFVPSESARALAGPDEPDGASRGPFVHPAVHRFAWKRAAALAACLAMLAVSAWSLWGHFRPPPACDAPVVMTRLEHYLSLQESGFPFETAFTGSESIRGLVESACGEPVDFNSVPSGVEIRGLSACPQISKNCVAVIARASGSDIVVYVDTRFQMIGLNVPGGLSPTEGPPAVREYSRELGLLLLVELSPLEEPRLLDHFQPPASGGGG